MLRARLWTAAVAIPVLLALIFAAPRWGFALVVGVLAALALVEYAVLAFPVGIRDRAVTLALGLPLVAAAALGPGIAPLAALTGITAAGLVWIVLARPDFERALGDLGLMLVGILYAGLLLPHFIWLRELDDGARWVTFVLAVGMAGDSGGYFVGHTFGRHRLAPRISPGKSVEGALGIVACGMAGGALAWLLLLRTRPFAEALGLAFAMAVVGQLGDLGESVMKRSFGAKDSGWIFPGHGGVLDRVDSLLFPVGLVYYYVCWAG